MITTITTMIIIIIMIQILFFTYTHTRTHTHSAGIYVQKLTAPFAMHSIKRKQLCIVDTIQFAKEEVAPPGEFYIGLYYLHSCPQLYTRNLK